VLTIIEVNRRRPRCRRCDCGHDIILPPLPDKDHIYTFHDRQDPVSFIGYLREACGCTRGEAQATYDHLTPMDGTCHHCRSELEGRVVADCQQCGALNLIRRSYADNSPLGFVLEPLAVSERRSSLLRFWR
jgi:hypothetical protein